MVKGKWKTLVRVPSSSVRTKEIKILPTTTTKITTDEICHESWVVTGHYRSYISRINGKCHRAFGPSDALAVTSRQNVSHRCFLTKTLSASAPRPPVDVSGPEEVPYA